jgi:hypothetical protein
LQRGFHTVQVTLSRVGRLLWSLGVALFNVGRIGKAQLGDGILVYLLKGATAFERWTSSARGVASITAAFAGARDVLHEVAHWLRVAREAAGPGLGDAIHNLADALKPLLNSGGGPSTLGLYVTGLSRLASAAGWIERNVPGASFALSGLATVLLASKLPFIGSGIAYTGKAMLFLGKAIVLTAAQTRIGAATFWLLNGALVGLRTAAAAAWVAVTGPVGLVVLAIAAVIGVAVLLYNKWGWFHRAVDNTFAFIRDHWPRLLAILTGPIGLAVLFVVQHFDQIKAKVGSVIDWMGRKIRGILNLAGRVKDGVLGLPGKLLGKARSILPFAHGGIVGSPLQLVGERGPELAALPMGSRVFTAPQTQTMLRAPRTATVHYGGGNAGSAGEGRPIHLHTTNVVQLDGKVLAKSMSTEVAREHGRRG